MFPKAGRILDLEGSKVIEPQTKDKPDDYGRIPVILRPRNSGLLGLAPELRWVGVNDAIEYVLTLSGMKGFREITLDAGDLNCVDDPLAAPSRICSQPWPAGDWPLEPGQRYFLTVAVRPGVAADLRPSEKSKLWTLAEKEAGDVAAEVAGTEAASLDAVTQDLLLAGVSAGHGLYGDAADAYERALAEQPSPAVYVALGDVYAEMALYRWAFEAYQQALKLLSEEDDASVRAAAEYGLGRVYYNYADNFAEAAKHFEAAVQLYEQVGAVEWVRLAQKGLEEAEKRSQ
jgi:tetratricopeptide (TPR) repeat protein